MDKWEVAETPNGLYVLHEGLPVAAVEPGVYAMKDARLIAAAPDMLAALSFIVNDAEPGENAQLTVDGYNRACAAIAKARGEG